MAAAAAGRAFGVQWLGRAEYQQVHEYQVRLVGARLAGEIPDTLLLVEHDPVITLGRGAARQNIIAAASDLAQRRITVQDTGRGGDVTYHGPGQLVAYPIFDLRPDRCDVRRYVRDLAAVMVLLAGDFGIRAGEHSKYIGAWVDASAPGDPWPGFAEARKPAKIGAIGVRISRWVTMHGFAFNATTTLSDFRLIVPCGIHDHPVTSLADLGVANIPSVAQLATRAVEHFETVFASRCLGFEESPRARGSTWGC